MRIRIALFGLCLALLPAQAADITDGRSLSDACQALRDTTADGTKAPLNDPCRSWLFGFFNAYKELHDARLSAYLSGASFDDSAGPCFRPPDFISFVDVAGLVVAHGKARPEFLGAPAERLVLEAMSAQYPCTAESDQTAP